MLTLTKRVNQLEDNNNQSTQNAASKGKWIDMVHQMQMEDRL